jgi:hypothetical protein
MFDPSRKCPRFKKKCLQHGCTHFIALRGADPQTGQPIDEWGCADVWQVVAQLEGNKEMRQTAAAIESFRNEMVRGQQAVLHMAANGDVKEIADARDDH